MISRLINRLSIPLYRNANLCKKWYSLDINTNVAKDFLIYKNNDSKYFRLMDYFIITQLLIWSYMSSFMLTLRDVPVLEDKSELKWWQKYNFGKPIVKNSISGGCLIIGVIVAAVTVFHSYKNIKCIFLMAGGNRVNIITYGPFNRSRQFTVPLKKCSCESNPCIENGLIRLRILGQKIKFAIDANGEFPNRELFVNTVGLKRILR